jgi:hypothetical protein
MANQLPKGYTLQSVMRDPGAYNAKGLFYVDPKDVEWKDVAPDFISNDPDQCDHSTHACSECTDNWREHWIFRVRHDATGKVVSSMWDDN